MQHECDPPLNDSEVTKRYIIIKIENGTKIKLASYQLSNRRSEKIDTATPFKFQPQTDLNDIQFEKPTVQFHDR